jgi:hypothetical protein
VRLHSKRKKPHGVVALNSFGTGKGAGPLKLNLLCCKERTTPHRGHPNRSNPRRRRYCRRRSRDDERHYARVSAYVHRVIAESQAMRDLLAFVRKVAASEVVSVLIEGENGTGKDLIAKTLHYQSLRQSGPLLTINCAAIPETLSTGHRSRYPAARLGDGSTSSSSTAARN